ncbi:tetratricopeptide repeat protein [bacterium]|nr:tetratricopeptide repeat protein [bacterium]
MARLSCTRIFYVFGLLFCCVSYVAAQKSDTAEVIALADKSHKYLNFNYDSSFYFGNKARSLAKDLKFTNGIALGNLRVGNVYNYQGNYDSASSAYQTAYDHYEKVGNYLGMANALNNFGLMYRNKADFPAALDYFMKSLELKKEYGTAKEMAVAYDNIGIVFAVQGDHSTAEEYMDQAIKLYKEAGDSSLYYSSLINISSLYREMERYDESINILQKAFEYHKREGNTTSVGICTYNMGAASMSKEDYEQAIEYYLEAKTVFSNLGNKKRLTGCYLQLATAQFKLNKLKSAEESATAGIALAEEIGSPLQEQKLFDLLSQILFDQGRFEEAYTKRLRYEQLQDSIQQEEHSLRLKEIQTQYQHEINRREIAELQAETELKDRKNTIQNYILIGVLILALTLAIMLYSRFRIKKRTNDALREKNEIIQHSLDEKEVLLREIHHRVQNNLQFVSSMLNLQARRVSDQYTLDVLQDCKLRIQSMALIHQKLYQENSLKGINILNYTHNLLDSLSQSYQIDSKQIQTHVDVDELYIDINTAIPIGLILNELITNAFKYAFKEDRAGVLQIVLKDRGEMLHLEVKDNGVGLPAGFDLAGADSFGLKLVNSLATKIQADLNIENNQGTSVVLQIKNFERIEHGS